MIHPTQKHNPFNPLHWAQQATQQVQKLTKGIKEILEEQKCHRFFMDSRSGLPKEDQQKIAEALCRRARGY